MSVTSLPSTAHFSDESEESDPLDCFDFKKLEKYANETHQAACEINDNLKRKEEILQNDELETFRINMIERRQFKSTRQLKTLHSAQRKHTENMHSAAVLNDKIEEDREVYKEKQFEYEINLLNILYRLHYEY